MKKKQKFNIGDKVLVKSDLIWFHFKGKPVYRSEAGKEGIIWGSYQAQFGFGSCKTYTLQFLKERVSWFDENDLTLVSKNKNFL